MALFHSKLPNVGTTIFTEMSQLANDHMAINLSQGFPNYDPDKKLRKLITYHMNGHKNQYAPMAGVQILRERISKKIRSLYKIHPNPDHEINITAGATQAIFTSIATFVKKDDEVIIIEPAFDCYGPAIELVGGKIVPFEMTAPHFRIDWDAIRSLITVKTSMIIVNTPHNPTGTILRDEDMIQLYEIVRGKEIIVLSDEVYEHLIFDGEAHCSVLNYPELFKQSIAVFSFGKTFHCTGWKVGYAVMPENLMKEFRKVHQFNVFSVNSFVQYALADYLNNPKHYSELPDFYHSKRDILTQYINTSNFGLIPAKGSYFVMADYSKIIKQDDRDFCKWLTTEKGIAAIPISVFYTSGKQQNIIRFCFAKTEEILHKAGIIIQGL